MEPVVNFSHQATTRGCPILSAPLRLGWGTSNPPQKLVFPSAVEGSAVALEDRREAMFGEFGPQAAGGAMNLKFSCIDGAGHCQLHVTIEADHDRGDLLAQRVEMLCAFEPAALDQFLKQMRELGSSLTGSAVLALP